MAKHYGAAKETSADLISGLAQAKKAKPLDKEALNTQSSINKQLDNISSQYGKISLGDKVLSLIPGSKRVNVNLANYNTTRNLIATDLAKLRQKGVLSDQDIKQAMDLFPPAASSTGVAQSQIQQVKDYISTRIAINSGGDNQPAEKDWNKLLQEAGL
jgi:type II secretory pathway component PulL